MCRPCWPWIHREPPAFASQLLGLKVCISTVDHIQSYYWKLCIDTICWMYSVFPTCSSQFYCGLFFTWWICFSLHSERFLQVYFCRTGLVIINSFSLFLSWKVFIFSPQLWELCCHSLGWQLSFRIWTVKSPSFHLNMPLLWWATPYLWLGVSLAAVSLLPLFYVWCFNYSRRALMSLSNSGKSSLNIL